MADPVLRRGGAPVMRVRGRASRDTVAGDSAELTHNRRGADDRDEHERDDLPEHSASTITRFRRDQSAHSSNAPKGRVHNFTRRRRSALPMTDTELSVIAALAQIGLMSSPSTGYSTPAATGTPRAL